MCNVSHHAIFRNNVYGSNDLKKIVISCMFVCGRVKNVDDGIKNSKPFSVLRNSRKKKGCKISHTEFDI